jgi:hypothetical protein
MSDVINVVIRARDEATKALSMAAKAADDLAEAQAAASQTGAALEGQATETADALREQAAAAQSAASKAGGAGGMGGSVDSPDHLKRTAAAADNAAGSVSNLSGRVMTLRYNLMDVGQQLAGGGSPFMVLMQQGPEIVGALGDATEAAEVLKAAFGPLIAGATSLATVLAAVGVAAAALGATYAVVANQTEILYSDLNDLRRSAEASSAAFERMTAAANATRAGVAALSRATVQSTEDLGVLVGTVDKYDVAARRKIAAMEAEQRANATAATQAAEIARRELEAQRALAKSTDAKVAERVAAQQRAKALESELAALQAVADQASADVDTMRANALTEAEYLRELDASNAALAEREERQRAAAQAAQDAAAANEAAAKAAAQWARDQGMVNAAAQDLARLIDDLAALPQILEDAATTSLIDAASKGLAEVGKELEGLAKTFGAMMADQMRRAASAGRAIGQVLGGDLIGVLSDWLPKIAGPVGAAIGGALQGLTALGEMGPGQVSGQITGAVQGIAKGLTNLPALIVKLVPNLLTKALPDLIVALVGLIPRLAVALVIELPVAIVRGVVGWWREIGGFRGIAASIADGVRTWWRETWDRVRAWLRDIFTPGDQGRGRRVSDARADELRAMQAAAMAVTDPRGRPGQPTDPRTYSRRGAGPQPAGPTLVIQAASLHPDVVPATLRDLDRMTRPGGLRRGTTGIGGT